jgi:hypothetical protein
MPKIKAVAFDGFTTFDPRPISAVAEELFPTRGVELSNLWRTRQFEYTWLRTLTGNYADSSSEATERRKQRLLRRIASNSTRRLSGGTRNERIC